MNNSCFLLGGCKYDVRRMTALKAGTPGGRLIVFGTDRGGLVPVAKLPSVGLVSSFKGSPCLRGRCFCVPMLAARRKTAPAFCGVGPRAKRTMGKLRIRTSRVAAMNGVTLARRWRLRVEGLFKGVRL